MLYLSHSLGLVNTSWVLPILLATTIDFLLESVEAVLTLLQGRLQCESDWTLAFLFNVDHASSHLFVLQLLRLLLSVLLHDSHLSHELLFFLLQQFFLAVTVDFVITAVLNLDEVVNALGIV